MRLTEVIAQHLKDKYTLLLLPTVCLNYLYSYCLLVGKDMTSINYGGSEVEASYVLVPNESLEYQCARLASGLVTSEREADNATTDWLIERAVGTMLQSVQVPS